eukprot:TRINITY_DN8271_c0_g1_i1.p1 TRINITY_DN8271_c0_g1~~TRINITY_DN8271_c0_g1_i1.p1  ORF type:complete len:442 (+),score=86.64 TRINITY_DN8271_c0_g1_i1:145-1470(+)
MGCCSSGQASSIYVPRYKEQLPEMDNKIVAITGCTTGTGNQLAKICVEKGAKVLLLNRRSERAETALEEIAALAEEHGAPEPIHIDCDLMHFDAVRKAAADVKAEVGQEGLDVLVNNAGIMGFADYATDDGYDVQMQTNHLSHFLLTHELLPLLHVASKLRGEARVVNHSSCARKLEEEPASANHLQAKYMEPRPEEGLGGDAGADGKGPRYRRYQQSKLANLIFTSALHDRLSAAGSTIKVACGHPGLAASDLWISAIDMGGISVPQCLARPYQKMMFMSIEDGTMGILKCSCDPEVQSGCFYGPVGRNKANYEQHDKKEYSGPAELMPADPFNTKEARDLLWEISCKSTGTGEWVLPAAAAAGVHPRAAPATFAAAPSPLQHKSLPLSAPGAYHQHRQSVPVHTPLASRSAVSVKVAPSGQNPTLFSSVRHGQYMPLPK